MNAGVILIPLERLWFGALDIERRRAVLGVHVRQRAYRALRAAAGACGVVVIDACVIASGVRVIVRAPTPVALRLFLRRFVATLAASIPGSPPRWRSRAQVVPLRSAALQVPRAYLRRCRASLLEDISSMKKARNVKRPFARTAVAVLRAVEQANAAQLGADEYNARVRRYVAAHDAPADDTIAFERLCAAIFAQGLGFDQVERRREELKTSFRGFAPAAVAALNPSDVDALMRAPIIRNRAKVEACVDNARRWVELAAAAGSYLARVARIAAEDDASRGWPQLLLSLQRDFRRLGQPSAGLTLKRWGFFTARAHPGSQRLLTRLGLIKPDAAGAPVQRRVGDLAQACGKDPYAVEAAFALFASVGPCTVAPQCNQCSLAVKCPAAQLSPSGMD